MKPEHKSECKPSVTVAMLLSATLLFICYATPSTAKEVTLGWSPNIEDVIGYKLYYKTGSDDSPPYNGTGINEGASPIVLGDVTMTTISGLSDSETYHFVLTAFNNEEESDFSDMVTVYPDPVPVILNIISPP